MTDQHHDSEVPSVGLRTRVIGVYTTFSPYFDHTSSLFLETPDDGQVSRGSHSIHFENIHSMMIPDSLAGQVPIRNAPTNFVTLDGTKERARKKLPRGEERSMHPTMSGTRPST